MDFILKFAQILFVGLLLLLLAAGTSSVNVDIRFHDTPDGVTADCVGMRHVSPDQKPSNKHSSGIASHCCATGHCWVAMQTGAPAMAVEVPGFRVADLTQEIAVVPAPTRLEKPPQQF